MDHRLDQNNFPPMVGAYCDYVHKSLAAWTVRASAQVAVVLLYLVVQLRLSMLQRKWLLLQLCLCIQHRPSVDLLGYPLHPAVANVLVLQQQSK